MNLWCILMSIQNSEIGHYDPHSPEYVLTCLGPMFPKHERNIWVVFPVRNDQCKKGCDQILHNLEASSGDAVFINGNHSLRIRLSILKIFIPCFQKDKKLVKAEMTRSGMLEV